MFRAFINVFRIPDLRNKVLFTLLMRDVEPDSVDAQHDPSRKES